MTGECGLKSANVTLPPGLGVLSFAGIPEHLLLYGFILVVSLIIYILIQYIKKCKRFTLDTDKPSLAKLVFGHEDDWLIRERGVAAYQYIMFLRMLLQLAVIFSVISGVSLAINISQHTFSESAFDSTTSSNIPPSSELHWFNLTLSFSAPWLVVMMVMRLSKKVGYLKPLTKTFNRTLLDLIKITWSTDTNVLQALFTELEFTEDVLEILEECKEENHEVCCCCTKSRDPQYYEEQKRKLSRQILEEKNKASEKTPCILFLTFLTHYQANQVYKQEKLDSKFCSLQDQLIFAPLPEEIIWSSVQSSVSKWRGWTISTICIFVLVIFCSTPAGFAAQIQNLLSSSIGDTSSITGVSTFLPPLLLILFSILVPLAVKIEKVNFGSCSRFLSHPSYMRSLYRWLACSTIIFPIILASAGNMLEFFYYLDTGGLKVALQKWECVFSADTGAFYINLLVVVASLKCQLELHRVGDWCLLVFAKISYCRFWEQGEAARRKWNTTITNRNGSRLALADDYVWVVVYFTIWMFFCLTCPIITPAFLIFIVSKYLVVSQNFRCFHTAKHDQPELLTTAAKLTIFASLFLQLNFTLFMIIRQSIHEENSTITATAIFLLLVNLVILIIHQRLNWSTPIKLFNNSREPIQPEADDSEGSEELGVSYEDDYENSFMTKEISDDSSAPANNKPAWKKLSWVGRRLQKRRRQADKYLPRDKIFSKTVGGAAQKAVQKAARTLVS